MALIKCRECGKEISDSSKKCVHCGSDVILEVECSECHQKYDNTTNVCPHCGKKNSSNISAGVNDAKSIIKKFIINHKKKILIICPIVLVVIVASVILANTVPSMLVTVEDYLTDGDYLSAYEKAKDDETKQAILLENIIAKISYEIADGLKDPDSFKLSHVYYDGEDELVFEIIGANSYGGNVTNYYDYRYDEDDEEYTLYVYLSSLEDEEYYSWDSSEEKLEIILKNAIRSTVIDLMEDDSAKVNNQVIDRVNNLFKQNKLRDVELIPYVTTFYPSDDYV